MVELQSEEARMNKHRRNEKSGFAAQVQRIAHNNLQIEVNTVDSTPTRDTEERHDNF